MKVRDLVILCLSTSLTSCYVAKQAYYHGNLYAKREQVDILLWENKLPADQKEKLFLVKDMLAFAKIEDLNVDGAYRTLIREREGAVSYLVFAAEKYELKEKIWEFPIVGKVPYLGFFDKQDRDDYAKELEAEGWDVYSGKSEAFSSLGWFDDPLFASMLENSEAQLANLLFHELVHRSYWREDAAAFNENLAEFLADKMTRGYLEKKNLEKELADYIQEQNDKEKYQVWLKDLRGELEKLFSKGKELSKAELEKQKLGVYENFCKNKFPKFQTQSLSQICSRPWNNARLLAASVYFQDKTPFEKAFTCVGAKTVGEFLAKLGEHKVFDELCKVSPARPD